jgi:hypothetical protein
MGEIHPNANPYVFERQQSERTEANGPRITVEVLQRVRHLHDRQVVLGLGSFLIDGETLRYVKMCESSRGVGERLRLL